MGFQSILKANICTEMHIYSMYKLYITNCSYYKFLSEIIFNLFFREEWKVI